MPKSNEQLRNRFERERAARLEAERLLEEKSDELYESLMQVKASEDLLRSALSSMADGLLLTNQYHEVILANDQLKEIYPDQAQWFERNTQLDGRFGLMLEHPDYVEMTRRGRRGSVFEITLPGDRSVSVLVRYTREGFIASTHRDITSLKEAEEERRKLLVDLMRAQRMEAIGRMSGMIAHDFNNIMASIRGYADFLQEDLPDDPGLHDSAARIQAAAEKAESLIQQILEYGNQQQAPRHRVSLIPVLEDCIDLISPTLPANVEFTFDPPEQPVWIEANESRLGRLFMNLFSNSRRAVAAGPGRLSLHLEDFAALELGEVRCAHADFPASDTSSTFSGRQSFPEPCVRITLIDNGEGIEPHVIDRIFEMYFSTRDAGTHGGVGLSSVADIVADYDGGIRMTSRKGDGTAVEVVFPVAMDRDRKTAETPVEASESPGRSCDVLLIDDDENVGEMIRQTLERNGISAEFQESSAMALEMLLSDHTRWKLVVSDQIMPGLKGSEIYARLREAGISIPFIICSAQIDPASGDIHDWLKDDFIAKPVVREELLSKVRKYL